jgi:hypothetical protein
MRSVKFFQILLVLAAVAAFSVTPALAAKGGNGGGNGGGSGHARSTGDAGSCSVTPDPVAVGDDYTVVGSGLEAGLLINVFVEDWMGTAAFADQTDATGGFSVTWRGYWSGPHTVSVYDISRVKPKLLTSCAFQVN